MQNLEVMYDQFVAKDGRRGMDWTEVAVCIVQVQQREVAGTAAQLDAALLVARPLRVTCIGTDPSRRLSVRVQDGIGNANESVLAASTVHGFFSPVVLQSSVLGAPTTLHLFEYTARCVGGLGSSLMVTCTDVPNLQMQPAAGLPLIAWLSTAKP